MLQQVSQAQSDASPASTWTLSRCIRHCVLQQAPKAPSVAGPASAWMLSRFVRCSKCTMSNMTKHMQYVHCVLHDGTCAADTCYSTITVYTSLCRSVCLLVSSLLYSAFWSRFTLRMLRTYVEAAAGRLTISPSFELSKAKTDTASPFLRLLLCTELLAVFFFRSSRTQFITPVVSIYLPFILSEYKSNQNSIKPVGLPILGCCSSRSGAGRILSL